MKYNIFLKKNTNNIICVFLFFVYVLTTDNNITNHNLIKQGMLLNVIDHIVYFFPHI